MNMASYVATILDFLTFYLSRLQNESSFCPNPSGFDLFLLNMNTNIANKWELLLINGLLTHLSKLIKPFNKVKEQG